VPSEDLISIPDNYRRALNRKLRITTDQALVEADEDTIYTELQHSAAKASRTTIAQWKREASSRLNDADIGRPEWEYAASFVVIFAQRRVDGGWERRLEAGQAEVPEPARQIWEDWDCQPLCAWMRGQLPADQAEPGAGAASESRGTPPAGAARSRTPRTQLRIDGVMITDASHERDLVTAGNLTEVPPDDVTLPAHLSITVSGARPGQQVQAAALFRRWAGPGWSVLEPVTIFPSGHAEFDLSAVPDGEHQIRLLAWATDAGARLAGVRLPKLTFLQPAR
jgi:hypothetical protein